jgi:hypothetical protein
MDFETDAYDHAEFDLSGQGENSSYRVDMVNKPGERNRGLMLSKGESYTVSATLLEVVHGKWKNGGDGEATLIIASFRFIPPNNRRFKYAKIDWTFTSDDPALDIKVAEVAPDAGWASDPITLKLERTIGVTGNVGASLTPANAGLTTKYEGKEAKDLVYHTSVSGTSRMEGLKNQGGPNSARWILKENPKQKQGICTMLQVAVLLRRPVEEGKNPKPRPEQTFKSTMEIVVNKGSANAKGFFSGVKEEVQDWSSKKTSGDQAVEYHPDKPSQSGDFIVDENNLHATNLEEIMFMSMSSSWEDLKKERQDRKRAKEDAEEKKQEAEDKKRKEEEEEDKKRQEQEAEDKKMWELEEQKRKEEEDKKRQEQNTKGVANTEVRVTNLPEVSANHAGLNALVQPQGNMLPQAQTPPWLYVALGILVMYTFQQLVKSWFGST